MATKKVVKKAAKKAAATKTVVAPPAKEAAKPVVVDNIPGEYERGWNDACEAAADRLFKSAGGTSQARGLAGRIRNLKK